MLLTCIFEKGGILTFGIRDEGQSRVPFVSNPERENLDLLVPPLGQSHVFSSRHILGMHRLLALWRRHLASGSRNSGHWGHIMGLARLFLKVGNIYAKQAKNRHKLLQMGPIL